MNDTLKTEFGERLVTLCDGRAGLRAGLKCEAKAIEGEPVMEFIATDETVDRYNEVIRLDGWQLDNYRANPVVVDSHDYSSITRILGSSEDVAIKNGKMTNRVRFAVDNELGLLALKLARGGFLRSQSVGFIPLEFTRGKQGEPDRTYIKQELLEISLVAIPANPGATIGAALKSGALVKGDVREAINALQRICNGTETTPGDAAPAAGRGDSGELLRALRELTDVVRRA